jgi:hypothetical protein
MMNGPCRASSFSSNTIMSTGTTQGDDTNEQECSDADESTILDYRRTPLDACSIETCPGHYLPCQTPETFTDDDLNVGVVAYLPMCLGCYQLDKVTGIRQGRLDLYAIPVVKTRQQLQCDAFEYKYSITSFSDNKCRPPLTLLSDTAEQQESGVLDGKWCPSPHCPQHAVAFQNYYATARASGEITIHRIFAANQNDDSAGSPFQAAFVGRTEILSTTDQERPGLCLALAWDQTLESTNASPLDTRIISSYSDGNAAIHRIQQASSSAEEPNAKLDISLENCWPAHKMFTAPAEVWCCAFVPDNFNNNVGERTNTVATGGDEGSWKLWDLRFGFSRPIYHNPDDFEAGVTVLSPHPRRPHLLMVGSYDETIALYDVRYVSSNSKPKALFHSDAIGGGIWRGKWHPKDDNRMLIAAMHGGCRVVRFADHLIAPNTVADKDECATMHAQQIFTKHKSMAYGADWLVHDSSKERDGDHHTIIETAASCSFYDQAMYLWDTDPTSAETNKPD